MENLMDSFNGKREALLRDELYRLCDKHETSREGIDYLIKYYMTSLGWTEEHSLEYAIGLFNNGTIQQIKAFNMESDLYEIAKKESEQ